MSNIPVTSQAFTSDSPASTSDSQATTVFTQPSSNAGFQEDASSVIESSSESRTPNSPNIALEVDPIAISKKRKLDNPMSPYQEKLIGYLETFKNRASKDSEDHVEDEYTFFGKSVAEQIRKLPTSYARARAKKEIQDVLFRLEFPDSQS